MPPVFSHGDLRLYLLSLLDESPRHGYDLMQALTERTGGTYSPSAGTIYPRLAKLEDEGLVTKTVDGRKTVYEITDAGRQQLDSRRHELDGIQAGLADSVRLIADEVRGSVRAAMKSLQADLAAAASSDRESAARAPHPENPRSETRAEARAEAQRADAAITEFRADVKADLRSHVARDGDIPASVIDDLVDTLGRAREDLLRVLRG